ncbi:uncharacterized protein LOC117821839 isoform X2 [Notolabrus celidotus]|nr:uncharacterized protein LOC117821839 isoform X2 [Notolabrus celidotus]
MLNISWAINIDASTKYLTATRIVTTWDIYHCEYNPPFAKALKANLTWPKQKWFHFLIMASNGFISIQAANIPLPAIGSGEYYSIVTIKLPLPKDDEKPKNTPLPMVDFPTPDGEKAVPHVSILTNIVVAILGFLACLMILSFCYIIYKSFGANLALSLGFKRCPPPLLPVPVLVVYPAENADFQRAVVALAEFLQWQGGCSIAVDFWQQSKIAELGLMCWLTEQVKAANRVLIVCPQRKIPLSYSSHSPNYCFPTLPISAATQDLYPLVLNMVMSNAKSSKDLAKFWVVQLGNQLQDKKSGDLAPELGACKTFYVMKDLNKLCRRLHEHRHDNKKISAQISRPWIAHSEKSAMMLKEAVEKIN